MMPGSGRRHDRALLDALEAAAIEEFTDTVWRVTVAGRDPLRGSTGYGRWSPPGEFEVLYTSLTADGALAEIGYRLSLEPVWPSRAHHELHRVAAATERTLRFATLEALGPLGVNVARYATFDYESTQAIAAAANFLQFDGLIVPSARSSALNLVLFTDRLIVGSHLSTEETSLIDWNEWRAENTP